MVLGLINNATLLVALCTLYSLLAQWSGKKKIWGKVSLGFLFGAVAVVGMMTPVRYTPGVIFDGRSIVLSMAGLFGGWTAGAIAGATAALYRLHLGGIGALPGVGLICSSVLIGCLYRSHLHHRPDRASIPGFLALGVSVHVVMLLWMLAMPWPIGLNAIRRLGLPILLILPAATVLMGLLLRTEERRLHAEQELQESEQFLKAVFKSIQDGISILNPDLTIRYANSVMKKWYAAKLPLEGKPCYLAYHDADKPCNPCPTLRCMQTGKVEVDIVPGLPGSPAEWLELYSYPMKDPASGEVIGVVEFVRDITERVHAEEELKIRNRITEIFLTVSDDNMYAEILQFALELTKSPLGLFGYIDEEGNWVCPSQTPKVWDHYQGPGKSITFPRKTWAGIWGRAMIEGKALYANTPFNVPEGHLPVNNALDVPVIFRGELIGNLLVANKEAGYDEKDKAILEKIAKRLAPILHARLQTEREREKSRRMEEQLRHASKMEAIGTLAAGVAHEFNNLLTVILGNAELVLLKETEKDNPHVKNLQEIKKACERGANLVRQLLAFSRQEIRSPKALDLNEVLQGMEKMLRRLIREDIDLKIIADPDLQPVYIDPQQMSQVIINLITNARDAMPNGGTITIETANAELDRAYFIRHGIDNEPGTYVMLTVTDTGIGMDEEVQQKIFEPFFTTKERGVGTGLGLATVYGIVKQNKGFVFVYSEPGQGTTMKVYLPVAGERTEAADQKETGSESDKLTGAETLLVVEDDEEVRTIATRFLEKYGYRILEAANAKEAIEICGKFNGTIHLMVTDVIMPGMNGKELFERLQSQRPNMKVLFMSGYTDNIIMKKGVLPTTINFIQKPFSSQELARKVRALLDGES